MPRTRFSSVACDLQRVERCLRRRDPAVRVLLGPAGMRALHFERHAMRGGDVLLCVDHDRLHRGGADIDPRYMMRPSLAGFGSIAAWQPCEDSRF